MNLRQNKTTINNVLLVLCTAILLSQLWGIAYTTGDDLAIAVARHREGGVFAVAINAATTQGRFYQLLTYPLVQLPSLFEPFLALNITRIISNALPFIAFYVMARQLFGIRVATTASFIGLGMFAAIGSFNPFHALPLWFNINAFLLMLSITLYHRRILCGDSLIVPSILYFASLLFYESFLLYLPVFAAIYWHACCSEMRMFDDFKNQMVRAIKNNVSMIVAVVAYLLIYAIFRAFYFKPELVGGGLTFSLAPAPEIINTIIKFSLSGFSWKIKLPSVDNLISLASLFSLMLGIGLTLVLNSTRSKEQSSYLRVPYGWLILIYCVCAPNILYAFTERYRDWVTADPYYIGSYYSAYAIALGLALIVTKELPDSKGLRLNWELYVGILIAFVLVSTHNFVNAQTYYDGKRQDALHWPAMQAAIPSLKRNNITHLCSETFVTHPSHAVYWSAYLKGEMGKDVFVRQLPNLPQHCEAYINYTVSNNQGLIEIVSGQEIIYSNLKRIQ